MEKVSFKRQFMQSFDSIYLQEEYVEPSILLKNIPTTEAIEQIASLLLRINTIPKKDNNFHFSYLSQWMMRMNRENQLKVLKFLNEYSHDFILTDSRACLRLLQLILKTNNQSNRELSKNDFGILFKSLMICNSLENKKQKEVFDMDITGKIEDIINKVLPDQMRNLEINRRKDFRVQALKVYYFFEFCQSDPKYKSYAEGFLNFYNFKKCGEYVSMILYPYIRMMANTEITCKIRIDEKDTATINFFNQFIINDKDITLDEDFIILRQYPVFKNDSDTFTILNINFFIDKLYQGFLFDFVNVIKACGHSSFNYGLLKSEMGDKFSEILLFYNVMEKCFPFYGDFKKTGNQLKTLLEEGEPDYFIRRKNEIFLFEFKDASLNSSIKYSQNAIEIKKELSEKFVLTKQNQNKTVNQLKNSIEDIFNSKYQQKKVDDFSTNDIIIYPIFVFTDISMESYGVNYYLKERLKIAINSFPHKDRVKELVLINLDTLIIFQDLFRKNLIDFSDCINSYINYVTEDEEMNKGLAFDEFFKYYITRKGYNTFTIPEDFNKISDILKSYLS